MAANRMGNGHPRKYWRKTRDGHDLSDVLIPHQLKIISNIIGKVNSLKIKETLRNELNFLPPPLYYVSP